MTEVSSQSLNLWALWAFSFLLGDNLGIFSAIHGTDEQMDSSFH